MAACPRNVLLLWADQQRADTVGPDKDPRLWSLGAGDASLGQQKTHRQPWRLLDDNAR